MVEIACKKDELRYETLLKLFFGKEQGMVQTLSHIEAFQAKIEKELASLLSFETVLNWSNWSWWLVAAFSLMVMYELWWIGYFRSERKLSDFYSNFLGIPLAGATLPVMAFFLLSIYGKVIWLLVATVILGIGHIGIHMQHSKELTMP